MTVNRERKMINTAQESVYIEGSSLKQISVRIKELIKAYGEDATIDWHTYPYDDGRYLYVFKDIPETDEAMAKRIAKEEEWDSVRKDHDRREYERLQKIYGEKK
jgi:hypothetical protein